MAGKYAVRAMMHLASRPFGTITPISDLSREWHIPENYLRKIIPLLAKAAVVHSRRGKGGGLVLARRAEEITFLDVVEAVEGKIFLNKCLMSEDMCLMSTWCSANLVWQEAQDAMKQVLNNNNFAELVEMNKRRMAEHQPEASVEGSAFGP
jgi:Rrf2 family protein